MKVIPFKRKSNMELSSTDKSLNLAEVCHQKLEEIEQILNSENNQVPMDAENCSSELRKINASLDLLLKHIKVDQKYKKVV